MTDIIDDLMGLNKEFEGLKSDFTSVGADMVGGEGSKSKNDVVEIWDPDKYVVKVGIRPDYCVHNRSDKATCSACVDVCPAEALSIEDGNLQIHSDLCIGCGLCVAACPTSALASTKVDSKKIFDETVVNAATGEMAYITCAQHLQKTPPAGVVVVPCLGDMTPELWFSLIAIYSNIAIWLPLDACEDCPVHGGEDMYTEAVETAEKWAREAVGFECDEKDLKVDKKYAMQRKDFMKTVLKGTVNVAAKANPLANSANKMLRSLDKHRKELTTFQRTLDKACGIISPDEAKTTLVTDRQLMMNTLDKYRELAGDIKIRVSKTEEGCNDCGACIKACPMGARRTIDGEVKTIVNYCVGCGLCREVCEQEAIHMVRIKATRLLSEVSDLQKTVDSFKAKATETAKVAAGLAKDKVLEGGDEPSETEDAEAVESAAKSVSVAEKPGISDAPDEVATVDDAAATADDTEALDDTAAADDADASDDTATTNDAETSDDAAVADDAKKGSPSNAD